MCKKSLRASPEFFHRDRTKKSGFSSYCKICQKANKREWYVANAEHARQYSSQWVRDNYERAKATRKEWVKNNPEKVKAYHRKSYQKHKAKKMEYKRLYKKRKGDSYRKQARDYTKRWRAENKEKVRIQWKVRQARKRAASGAHTTKDIRELYELQHRRCGYCGISLFNEYHVDHIMPLSKNGSNDPENLMIACRDCNLSKRDRLFDEWKRVRGW